MGKNKNKNIVISEEELQPTTLGYLEDTKKGNGLLIAFFAIFLLFAIFLPNITSYVNKLMGKNPEVVVVDDDKKKTENPDAVEIKLYDYSEELSFNYNDIEFKNFKQYNQNGKNYISFTMVNNGDKTINLKTDRYYLETYTSDKTAIGRHILNNGSLAPKGTLNQIIELNSNEVDNIIQLTIINKTEKDYPDAGVQPNDNGISTLTCTKNEDTITYTFDKEGKLTTIKDVINYNNDGNVLYSSSLANYRSLTSTYNNKGGVSANLIEVSSGFTATIEIEIKDASINELNNENYYDVQSINVVNFEMESRGYNCN